MLYRQRVKEVAADDFTTPGPRGDEVKRVLRFLQIQVESREESKVTQKRATSNATSVERQVRDNVFTELPSALALATGSSLSELRACPLCEAPDHGTEDCQAKLSGEEKR